MRILPETGRQSGKSTELVKISAETGQYIIVTDTSRARSVADLAKRMGVIIPFPITVREMRQDHLAGMHQSVRERGFLVDDLDDVLRMLLGVRVDVATFSGPR